MLTTLPIDPVVTAILTVGALVAALAVIWTKALLPFGRWVVDAVKNVRRIGDLLERMIDFLERERTIMIARLDAGDRFHEEIDARVKSIERGGE